MSGIGELFNMRLSCRSFCQDDGLNIGSTIGKIFKNIIMITPQPLYNTISGILANFCVSCPFCVIMRVNCIVMVQSGNIAHLR